MPKYTSQIKSEESVEKVNSLVANFLAAQGYKSSTDKKGNYWLKGSVWFQYVRYAYTQGIINIEVWNSTPLPGVGSYLMYFIRANELKGLLKDLERLFTGASSPDSGTPPVPSPSDTSVVLSTTEGIEQIEEVDDSPTEEAAQTRSRMPVWFAPAWFFFGILVGVIGFAAYNALIAKPAPTAAAAVAPALDAVAVRSAARDGTLDAIATLQAGGQPGAAQQEPQGPQAAGENAFTVRVANRQGDPNAKVTIYEFSDFQ